LLREGFNRAFPVDEAPGFSGLLHAIDDADRAFSAMLRPDDYATTAPNSRMEVNFAKQSATRKPRPVEHRRNCAPSALCRLSENEAATRLSACTLP
jgi:hypothetical protein